jgi:uncharacterized alpha-E superfamily protein
MLARNAESLYWTGRYVERADDTARILDVGVHQLLEDASVDPDRASRTLLAVLGIRPPTGAELDVRSLTELVSYDEDNPGSIVASLTAARENARGAREVISSEMWMCLNATYNALADQQRYARLVGPHEFLSYVEDRAAMFAGLADSTMSRDDGWRFLVLGRSIERVDMTVRLVQFLLLDRTFPRSVFATLRTAENCLELLDRGPNTRIGAKTEALRLLGRARSELEFLVTDELLDDLPTLLVSLQDACREAGEAATEQYFHAAGWVAWHESTVDPDLSTMDGAASDPSDRAAR